MPFTFPIPTSSVKTGNVRTSYDPFTPAPGATTPGPTPGPFSNLACPLGSVIMDQGGPDSVSGSLTQLPLNVVALYKYCLYKSTGNPAVVAGPAPVCYADETMTVVSGVSTEAFAGGMAGALAGFMMVNSTDLTTLTATLLNNGGNGSGVWVCIGGFVKNAFTTVGTAGTMLVGAAGNWVMAAATATFAPGTIYGVQCLVNVASSLSDVYVRTSPSF